MIRFTVAAGIFLSLSSMQARAQNAEQNSTQQSYLSFQLLHNGHSVRGGIVQINKFKGFFSKGQDNHYARTRCENGGGTLLSSIEIFSGMTMDYKVEGKELILDLAQLAVTSRDAEIKSLEENECRNLEPQQFIVFKQTIRVPYMKSAKAEVVPLESGYAFSYQIFPQPP